MTNEEIVKEAREVKEMNWRKAVQEKKKMEFTPKLLEMFAQCHAMISVLAENRIMAQVMFKAMPDECVESFERDALIVLKYIEDLED